MNHSETALGFVRCFAAGDIEGLASLLDEDLRLSGPYLTVDSRAAYLDALHSDPPGRCGVEILSVTENGDEVAVFYEYLKPDGKLTAAQWFRFGDRGIREIRIVF